MAVKKDLIDMMAEKMDISKVQSEYLLNACLKSFETALRNKDEVKLTGLGTLKVVKQKEKNARNMQTGEKIKVPERNKVKFNVGKNLKEKISNS